MKLFGTGGESFGDNLGRTGGGETGKSHIVIVIDQFGSFLCRENWESHIIAFIFLVLRLFSWIQA